MTNYLFFMGEEVRCDFVVTEKRKKIWKTQLDIAQEIKRICEKHHIKYFIIWGTLLGAVRHKGYIPWDDDFDIGFLRCDYERFCKIARKEIKSPLFVQDALSDPEYFIGYTRIRDSRTTGWILENSSPTYNNGIYVDLYPLDVIPKNEYVWKVQSFVINNLLKRLWKNRASKKSDTIYRGLVFLHGLCCCAFNWEKRPEKVGNVYQPFEIEEGYWFYAKDVRRTVQMPFENTSFSAPAAYKSLLRTVYGEYMKYPPKRKRGEWHRGQVVFEPDISYREFYQNRKRRKGNAYESSSSVDFF